jgi:hypothetical protein
MSLINDALKHAKESQRKDSPSGLSPLRPVETNRPEREFNMVLPVIISFLIVAALVLIGLSLAGHAHKTSEAKVVVAPEIVSKPEVAAAIPLAAKPPAPAALLVNPPVISTPVVATNPIVATLPAPKPLRLQGIAYAAVHPSAIIGGKAVYVGSLVDGMRVTAILPDSVTLAGSGRTKTLVVGEP